MKPVISLLLLVLAALLGCHSAAAQPARGPAANLGPATKANAEIAEKRSGSELFVDADKYANRKFEALNKSKTPYDTQLAEKIKKEQRDLAAAYAKVLGARKIAGQEIYYLGLLYNLAKDFDNALVAMRRFLAENPEASGEPAQNARAIVVIQAARKGLLSEAETRLAEYAANQPQVAEDRYTLENWVAAGYFNAKDYDHAQPHAQEMWTAAKLAVKKKPPFARDATLNEAAVMLSEVDLKAKRQTEALAVIKELRALALSFPSGNLYKLSLRRLVQIDPNIDIIKADTELSATPGSAPEITAEQWLDQTPAKLGDLRGRVVLLDFWAHWCGPCRATFPRLKKWHDDYKDKGLVILGLTTFYGHAEGKQLTPPQEIEYLRDFKKRFSMPYGVAVSDSDNNDNKYAVSSIPTTFLIDRRGFVRFISVGSSDAESNALHRMIKKLLDEPTADSAEAKAP